MPGDFCLDYGQTELILYNKENKMNRFLIIGYMVLGGPGYAGFRFPPDDYRIGIPSDDRERFC